MKTFSCNKSETVYLKYHTVFMHVLYLIRYCPAKVSDKKHRGRVKVTRKGDIVCYALIKFALFLFFST